MDFAAYRKLISAWEGKDSEDAVSIINWVAESLRTDMGTIKKIVDNSYQRGQMDALNNSNMNFHIGSGLSSILTPIVHRVLSGAYESHDIKFEGPVTFTEKYGIDVINGIVKSGHIPSGAKRDKNVSAAQNFGRGLKIVKKGDDKELDTSENPYVQDIWSFINDKIEDYGQTIRMETIYKNFMGIGGPNEKNYGLTRRIVQMYLLCLVQQGLLRIRVGPKAGLPLDYVDYSNIGNIDFNKKVLDSLQEIQKLEKPENWEILRPYAEKILGNSISDTTDDTVISKHRKELKDKFAEEKGRSKDVLERANSLFQVLKSENPYKKDLQQVAKLFSNDLDVSNDIDHILYSLKMAFGYKALDENRASQSEVDDLANRMKSYQKIQTFIEVERELETGHDYCSYDLPNTPELETVRDIQKVVSQKMSNLQPYIDSDVKLSTELIGTNSTQDGDTKTIGALVREYTTKYAAMHDNIITTLDDRRQKINQMLNSDEMKVLYILDGVDAIQQKDAQEVKKDLEYLGGKIFTCSTPSRAAVDRSLRDRPEHDCGLSFYNADEYLKEAEDIVDQAQQKFFDSFNRKMEFFLSPTIRERLGQGEKEFVISELLQCQNVSDLRSYLVKACIQDPQIINTINKYLKKITIKQVKISNFQPSIRTVEREQVDDIVEEFKNYLENQFGDCSPDTHPMIQLE